MLENPKNKNLRELLMGGMCPECFEEGCKDYAAADCIVRRVEKELDMNPTLSPEAPESDR